MRHTGAGVGGGDRVADVVTGVDRGVVGVLDQADGCAVDGDGGDARGARRVGVARAVVGGGEVGAVVDRAGGAGGLVGWAGDVAHKGGARAGQVGGPTGQVLGGVDGTGRGGRGLGVHA